MCYLEHDLETLEELKYSKHIGAIRQEILKNAVYNKKERLAKIMFHGVVLT